MKDTHIRKFDTVYGTTDCYYGTDLRREFTDFFEKISISGWTALDLGCGEGRYSLYLARKGCHVDAVDRSAAGIRKLQDHAEEKRLPVTARVADIEEFDFDARRFDLVVAATVLDHLDDGPRRRAIAGIKDTLKPGGIAYINVFTESDPGFAHKKKAEQAWHPTAGPDRPAGKDVSETAECMEYYFKAGELRACFDDFDLLYYYEGTELDLSHGQAHHHGWACLLARKPGDATPPA